MRSSDYIIDIGPRAGVHGGQVVNAGTYQEIIASQVGETAQYLSGAKHITRDHYMSNFDTYLTIHGAQENNLQNITVSLPTQ